ncbi:hypothetical protein PIB30_094066, partial [Stylosanthes scabra]|nr:hypothetical protein [Stylosanthes scabra]
TPRMLTLSGVVPNVHCQMSSFRTSEKPVLGARLRCGHLTIICRYCPLLWRGGGQKHKVSISRWASARLPYRMWHIT